MSSQPKQKRLYSPECSIVIDIPIKQDNFIICESLHSKCFSKFNEMRSNKQLCDVKLVSKNRTKKIWAHKLVLAANSEYFNIMFNGHFIESNVTEIVFEQLDGIILTLLIDFIYTSKLIITEKNMHEILNGFCLLQFSEQVQIQYFDYIKSRICPDNCLGLKETAECLGLKEFGLYCFKYILMFFTKIIETTEFLSISRDQLQEIIENEELCVCEEIVYTSVMKWTCYDLENRQEHVPSLMRFVRLPITTKLFMTEVVDKELLLQCHNECIRDVSDAHRFLDGLRSASKLKKPFNAQYRQVYSEFILIVSKNDAKSSPLLFNAITKRWKYLQIKLPSFSKGTSYLLSDGRIIDFTSPEPLSSMRNCANLRNYLDGWSEAIIHELSTEKIIKMTTSPMCEVHAENNIVQIGNRVYVICYFNSEYYDIDQNKWFRMKYSSVVRTCYGVIALNGFIYTVGGNIGKSDTNMVEKYNPETCEWSAVAPMKYGRRCVTLCVFEGCIYAIGGTGGSLHRHIFLNVVEKYDPAKNTWEDVVNLNYSRANAGAATVNGLLYVFGGSCENSSIEEYCPFKNRWTVVPLKMPKRFSRNTVCNAFAIRRCDQQNFVAFSLDNKHGDV